MRACKHAKMNTDSPEQRHRRPSALKLEAKEPLQVRIPISVKRRFKSCAALNGVEPNELFCEIWAYYEAAHANPVDKESAR